MQTLFFYAENAKRKFTSPQFSWSLNPRSDLVSTNTMQGPHSVAHGVSILMGPSIILLAWVVVDRGWFWSKQLWLWLQGIAAKGSSWVSGSATAATAVLIVLGARIFCSQHGCCTFLIQQLLLTDSAEAGDCSWEVSPELPPPALLKTILWTLNSLNRILFCLN